MVFLAHVCTGCKFMCASHETTRRVDVYMQFILFMMILSTGPTGVFVNMYLRSISKIDDYKMVSFSSVLGGWFIVG